MERRGVISYRTRRRVARAAAAGWHRLVAVCCVVFLIAAAALILLNLPVTLSSSWQRSPGTRPSRWRHEHARQLPSARSVPAETKDRNRFQTTEQEKGSEPTNPPRNNRKRNKPSALISVWKRSRKAKKKDYDACSHAFITSRHRILVYCCRCERGCSTCDVSIAFWTHGV